MLVLKKASVLHTEYANCEGSVTGCASKPCDSRDLPCGKNTR